MIVDASVAFKWIFVEENTVDAVALAAAGDLHAPTLLLVEIGNALWKKANTGELGEREAFADQLALVASLVHIHAEAVLAPRALEMALILEHPIYDCVYLALAELLDDRLVSADVRFVRKVRQSGWSDRVVVLG